MQSNQKYCNVSKLQILSTIKYNVNLSCECKVIRNIVMYDETFKILIIRIIYEFSNKLKIYNEIFENFC